MTQLIIREATRDDIEPTLRAKLAIHRECYPFRGEEVFGLEGRRIPQLVRFWEAGMELGMRFFVAVDGEKIVGMSGARPTPEDDPDFSRLPGTELQMLYLDQAYRGSGAGQLLLTAAIASLPAHLWVLEDNKRAIAFYRKAGFETTGEREQLDDTWDDRFEIRMIRTTAPVAESSTATEVDSTEATA